MENTTEKVFYQDQKVSVTQSRLVASEKTYAMRNISSVSLFQRKKSRVLEILLVILGTPMLFDDGLRVTGTVIVIIAILLWVIRKDEYTVRINSNSGEADGFVSKDRELIQKIVNAVNEAIIFRG